MMATFSIAPSRKVFGAFLLAASTFANAQVSTFNYTGAEQTYTLPAGASGVIVQVSGAGGAGGGADAQGTAAVGGGVGGAGGTGVTAAGTYLAVSGTQLKIYVGGGGTGGVTSSFGFTCANSAGAAGSAGGVNGYAGGAGALPGCGGYSGGGGGGGGASVVSTSAGARLFVAGGGGGGQGGSWESFPIVPSAVNPLGTLPPGSAGAAGLSLGAGDGGGGGGGGGGCQGGAGGSVHNDKSGTANGTAALKGGSCAAAAVTGFSILGATGGVGGAGNPADPSSTNNLGGKPGGDGSVIITPVYPTLNAAKAAPTPALAVGVSSSYTITVSNTGAYPANSATVQDQLPGNVTYVSSSGTGWVCSPTANAGGTLVTCNFTGTIAPTSGTTAVQITVSPSSNATVTNYASVDAKGASSPPVPTSCTAANAPSAGCAAPVVSAVSLAVSGSVYSDTNHNGSVDGSETGTGLLTAPLFVKLAPASGAVCSALATAAAPVNVSTGTYSIANVAQGTYCLILDTNNLPTDITPGFATGWIGTQNASGMIFLTIGVAPPSQQNFGKYNGSTVSGIVFADTGAGVGIANTGAKDGGEPGIASVSVKATSGATIIDTAVTAGDGSYTLWVPAATTGTVIITPVAPGGDLATGGSPGTTTGSYTRPSVSYTAAAGGQNYSGVNFGLVPPNTLAPSGAQTALPGTVVFYDHVFQAGSAGQITFSLSNTSLPTAPAWTQVLYQDSNCNGVLDAAEPQISAPLTVTAGQKICLIVKQFVPAGAAFGAQNSIKLSAAFTYVGAVPALFSTLSVTDITTVGAPGELVLTKLVSNVTQTSGPATAVNAKPSDILQYTLTAVNNGTQTVSATALKPLLVSDTTPAFTSYVGASAVCPVVLVLPAGLVCAAVSAPGAGATGALQWTFTGALAPSAQFSVTYQVKVDQ
jgi:uncharacterized repeat protein (TIGR01451 family)